MGQHMAMGSCLIAASPWHGVARIRWRIESLGISDVVNLFGLDCNTSLNGVHDEEWTGHKCIEQEIKGLRERQHAQQHGACRHLGYGS